MTLGGQTLPDPHTYTVERDVRGGMMLTASGALVEDVFTTTKHTWTMAFRNVTSTQRTAIESAFSAIIGDSAAFVDFEGASKTVTRDDSQRALVWEYSRTAGGIRYATTLVLREV